MNISKSKERQLFGKTNEEFVGTQKNEDQYNKVLMLQKLAKKLKATEDLFFECEIEFEDPENRKQNCGVFVRIPAPVLILKDEQKVALAEMILTCDIFTTAKVQDEDMIQYAFGIHNVWLP